MSSHRWIVAVTLVCRAKPQSVFREEKSVAGASVDATPVEASDASGPDVAVAQIDPDGDDERRRGRADAAWALRARGPHLGQPTSHLRSSRGRQSTFPRKPDARQTSSAWGTTWSYSPRGDSILWILAHWPLAKWHLGRIRSYARETTSSARRRSRVRRRSLRGVAKSRFADALRRGLARRTSPLDSREPSPTSRDGR